MLDRVTTCLKQTITIDAANALLGIALLLAPWGLSFTDETAAALNAWIAGGAIALIAVDALLNQHRWEEWANFVFGVWTVAAPWLLGFAGVSGAMYAHVVVGVIVAILAAVGLWTTDDRPVATA